jgi:anti-sigma regulatory factor (Ser/Thr protein kinase)
MTMIAPARATLQNPYRIRVSLAPGPPAAAQARRHVGAIIETWQVPVDPAVAVLLTSELVTNAIRHDRGGHEPIQLVITWAANELCVEVHDRSRAAPVPVDAPPDAEAGRGLMLLASLSKDWGYRETAGGKAVYFTLVP